MIYGLGKWDSNSVIYSFLNIVTSVCVHSCVRACVCEREQTEILLHLLVCKLFTERSFSFVSNDHFTNIDNILAQQNVTIQALVK